jgi:hypothetical protein
LKFAFEIAGPEGQFAAQDCRAAGKINNSIQESGEQRRTTRIATP